MKKRKLSVEEFDALPKNEKAVLVAKDVLMQIKLKKYIPNAGSYIKGSVDYDSLKALGLKKKDDVKNNFDKIPPCKVCALGSMLLSCTNLGNRLTFSDVDIINSSVYNLDKPKIKKLFNSIFDAYQLLLIENAFEKPSNSIDRYAKNILGLKLSEEDFDKCYNFYRKYNSGYFNDKSSNSERMVAICKNIIKNKGRFVL